MTDASRPLSRVTDKLHGRSTFYSGVDDSERPHVRNLVVFVRKGRAQLQQKRFGSRSHHRHVLILVQQTAGSVMLDGDEIPLREGQALLVRPFQFHHYVNLQGDNLNWLFITFELAMNESALARLSHRVLTPNGTSRKLWESIESHIHKRDKMEQAEALPLLDHLLFRLIHSVAPVGKSPKAATTTSWIAKVESLILESVHEAWTVDDIGRKVGLSGRRLRTLFEAETGVSIRDYRANYQLHRAVSLMRNAQLPMGRIAELCGFNSQSVFNRFIQRETHKNPRALQADIFANKSTGKQAKATSL